MRKRAIVFLAGYWMFLLWAVPCAFAKATPDEVKAVQGVLDLRGASSAQLQRIALDGEWAFDWRQFISPADMDAAANDAKAFIQVPSSWDGLAESGASDYGYATYRLRILLPQSEVGKSRALYIPAIGSAFRIWIDGEHKGGEGVIGQSRTAESPNIRTSLIPFEVKRPVVDIVMHVSNFAFREAGIYEAVGYGDAEGMLAVASRAMLYDALIIGAFMAMGLYYLVIFLTRNRERLALYLGIVFLAFAARTFFMDTYLAEMFFKSRDWEYLVKCEYLAELVAFLFLIIFVKRMYPQESVQSMLKLTYAVTAALAGYILLFPAYVYTDTMLLQSVAKAVLLVFFVYYVGIKAALRRREGSWINLAAMVLFFIALINDSLYWANLLPTVELLGPAGIFFLLTQAAIVSYRYSQLARRNAALRLALKEMNAGLEHKVAERTYLLREKNRELQQFRENRSTMLVNIAHDLGTPLIGMQTHLSLMEMGKITSDRKDLIRQMLDKFEYIQRLIHDLYELAKLESPVRSFRFEWMAARQWLEPALQQLRTELQREAFELHVDRLDTRQEAEDGLWIHADRYRLMQVLQNYCENAVKFSRDRSNVIAVRASIQQNKESGGRELIVEVQDNGIGMDAAELEQAFRRFYKKREGYEQGSGLGLAIVKEIVEMHGGRVGARSDSGRGSTFYFAIPAYATPDALPDWKQ
ncbi:sensor histidine kinase [Paenibacillus sp. IB182496]|uniref:histidine kinase n=1 Tax=Paenibacillus sabuli TaxID=2772509 RepID=A0A927GU10_9BACL|nr:sensor histidine kinase [Paenibacillus sabuli]MBD2848429.1 sensor histidine kinase [Paenibacillus sabuli]